MKHETKAEQIDRLKNHNTIFWRLDYDDRKLFVDMDEGGDHILVRRGDSNLAPKPINESLMALSVYCIPEDYEPEPDTPIFPGYEVCEVKPDDDGLLCFNHGKGKEYEAFLSAAPNLGCCGYVPKEKIGGDFIRINNPLFYVDEDRTCWSDGLRGEMENNGWSVGELGWVCFKEEVK